MEEMKGTEFFYRMFEKHSDSEYDEIVLIKSVEYLNVDSEQVLIHSNS
jgi:hypothetical protein